MPAPASCNGNPNEIVLNAKPGRPIPAAILLPPANTPYRNLHPVAWRLVVAVHLAAIVGRPFEVRIAVVVWRAFQLPLVQIYAVATLLRVVLHAYPPYSSGQSGKHSQRAASALLARL